MIAIQNARSKFTSVLFASVNLKVTQSIDLPASGSLRFLPTRGLVLGQSVAALSNGATIKIEEIDPLSVVSAAAAGSLSTNLTGANNDLVFTAKAVGVAGNSISITYTDPGSASHALGVAVVGSAINVTLATGVPALASLTTAQPGANNDITFTAKSPAQAGTTGNAITIEYSANADGQPAVDGTVTGSAINILLQMGGGSGGAVVTSSVGLLGTATGTGTAKAVITGLPGGTVTIPFAVNSGEDPTVWGDRLNSALQLSYTSYGSGDQITVLFNYDGTLYTPVMVVSNNSGSTGIPTQTIDTSVPSVLNTILSTAQDVLDWVASGVGNAVAARALVTAANAGGNDGTGVIESFFTATHLAGGSLSGAITSTAAQIKAAIDANTAAAALVSVANKAANDGSGIVTAISVAPLTGGADLVLGSVTQTVVASVDLADTDANKKIQTLTLANTLAIAPGANLRLTVIGGATATTDLADIVVEGTLA